MTTSILKPNITFTDPPIAVALFNDTRFAWLWLLARVYLGYTWISSGIGKLSNPAWVSSGDALQGFWQYAVSIPEAPARPPIAFEWYRSFIQFMLDNNVQVWFAKLVVAGEILIGAALIIGIFTGVAAFLGGFMNWNFMMAGTASINPVMIIISIALILAWKTAGWLGMDRWILPALGTPWRPGKIFDRKKVS